MLTDTERKNLTDLQERCDRNELVELDAPSQILYWVDMSERGYAIMRRHARVGLELVKGDYVKISEAGRFALRHY